MDDKEFLDLEGLTEYDSILQRRHVKYSDFCSTGELEHRYYSTHGWNYYCDNKSFFDPNSKVILLYVDSKITDIVGWERVYYLGDACDLENSNNDYVYIKSECRYIPSGYNIFVRPDSSTYWQLVNMPVLPNIDDKLPQITEVYLSSSGYICMDDTQLIYSPSNIEILYTEVELQCDESNRLTIHDMYDACTEELGYYTAYIYTSIKNLKPGYYILIKNHNFESYGEEQYWTLYAPNSIPLITDDDEGAFLRVVGGEWKPQKLLSAEEVIV